MTDSVWHRFYRDDNITKAFQVAMADSITDADLFLAVVDEVSQEALKQCSTSSPVYSCLLVHFGL